MVADVQTPHGTFTLLGTHPLPPVGRARSDLRNGQLAALPAVTRRATSPVLLLGDLNVSPWSSHFRRLLREAGLRDSARGWGVQASWPTTNPLLRIPLDHGLHGPGIVVVGRRLGPRTGSDHFPLIVDFVLEGGAATRSVRQRRRRLVQRIVIPRVARNLGLSEEPRSFASLRMTRTLCRASPDPSLRSG